MLAALGGQLCRYNFGVNLVRNSNLGLINSGVLFKVKYNLTGKMEGFQVFSFSIGCFSLWITSLVFFDKYYECIL